MNEITNTMTIQLDGKLNSALDWKKAKEAACLHVQEGMKIFWELDLGLMSELRYPLSSQAQFKTLKLTLEHFRDTLWKEFHEHSAGVSIYRGSIDFAKDFIWDKEHEITFKECYQQEREQLGLKENGRMMIRLFCRDAVAEYLTLLISHLPERMKVFLLLDAASIDDPVHQAHLLSKEKFSDFHLVVSGSSIPLDPGLEAKSAVCLPSNPSFSPSDYGKFREFFHKMAKEKLPFRIIPEALLPAEWEGLDEIYIAAELITSQGRRFLKGFQAAGGKIIEMR